MKISIERIRSIINEVLNEMPYMRPHHMRGVGPDVDLDARNDGRGMVLTSEQMLLKHKTATTAFVKEMREWLGQGKSWSPKEIMDLFRFYEGNDGFLTAESTEEFDEMMSDPTGSTFVWDPTEDSYASWNIH